jgi:hypothetical protein
MPLNDPSTQVQPKPHPPRLGRLIDVKNVDRAGRFLRDAPIWPSPLSSAGAEHHDPRPPHVLLRRVAVLD